MCAGCHRKGHDKPPVFVEWLKEYLGEDIYYELMREAKTKVDKNIYDGLIERIKEYEHGHDYDS